VKDGWDTATYPAISLPAVYYFITPSPDISCGSGYAIQGKVFGGINSRDISQMKVTLQPLRIINKLRPR
jgi:hypothetical protein